MARTANDNRSDAKNPNNAAYSADQTNRFGRHESDDEGPEPQAYSAKKSDVKPQHLDVGWIVDFLRHDPAIASQLSHNYAKALIAQVRSLFDLARDSALRCGESAFTEFDGTSLTFWYGHFGRNLQVRWLSGPQADEPQVSNDSLLFNIVGRTCQQVKIPIGDSGTHLQDLVKKTVASNDLSAGLVGLRQRIVQLKRELESGIRKVKQEFSDYYSPSTREERVDALVVLRDITRLQSEIATLRSKIPWPTEASWEDEWLPNCCAHLSALRQRLEPQILRYENLDSTSKQLTEQGTEIEHNLQAIRDLQTQISELMNAGPNLFEPSPLDAWKPKSSAWIGRARQQISSLRQQYATPACTWDYMSCSSDLKFPRYSTDNAIRCLESIKHTQLTIGKISAIYPESCVPSDEDNWQASEFPILTRLRQHIQEHISTLATLQSSQAAVVKQQIAHSQRLIHEITDESSWHRSTKTKLQGLMPQINLEGSWEDSHTIC